MKIIVTSDLVSQNGYNYTAHLCDDGLVYIDWQDRMGFQSSQMYFNWNGHEDIEVGETKGHDYNEAEKTLKAYFRKVKKYVRFICHCW